MECPVVWYCMFLLTDNSEFMDPTKIYMLQLGEHNHQEPPNVRPPDFISLGLQAAFLDSILNKGKVKSTQLAHHSLIDCIRDLKGEFILNKTSLRFDRWKTMKNFFGNQSDIKTVMRVFICQEGLKYSFINKF